ncbi:MAG: DUF4278 domain-containing protein [Limnothrix sp. RL_2_0]|nr:DUF4278 domain-containing protein [Limnothrix sp. RL_2_0]
MKLTYRGVPYNQTPVSLEVTEGDILGRYRGQSVRRHLPATKFERPEVESMLLHYRGQGYRKLQATVQSAIAPVHQAPAASCPIPLSKLAQLMPKDVRQVHIENMRHSLEERLRAAQAKGDEHLVNLLQRESNQLWPSH